jgi:import inner membrane translocase subunit TIM50
MQRKSTDRIFFRQYFNKPVWSELLPPPLPAPLQKPYTLLLSIDDLLVTSTWDVRFFSLLSCFSILVAYSFWLQRQHGWRTAKRPGVDYFLAYISQFYEVVIFTTQHHYVRAA